MHASIHGTSLNAKGAVDTVNRVNIELWAVIVRVNAIYRANVYTSPVFDPNARLTDDVRHCCPSILFRLKMLRLGMRDPNPG